MSDENYVKLRGTVMKVYDLKSFKGGQFKTREFTLMTQTPHKAYHNIKLWNDLAEMSNVEPGQTYVVIGSKKTESWTDKDGTKKYKEFVVASEAFHAHDGIAIAAQAQKIKNAVKPQMTFIESGMTEEDVPF